MELVKEWNREYGNIETIDTDKFRRLDIVAHKSEMLELIDRNITCNRMKVHHEKMVLDTDTDMITYTLIYEERG